jgi:hypothetical protein
MLHRSDLRSVSVAAAGYALQVQRNSPQYHRAAQQNHPSQERHLTRRHLPERHICTHHPRANRCPDWAIYVEKEKSTWYHFQRSHLLGEPVLMRVFLLCRCAPASCCLTTAVAGAGQSAQATNCSLLGIPVESPSPHVSLPKELKRMEITDQVHVWACLLLPGLRIMNPKQ